MSVTWADIFVLGSLVLPGQVLEYTATAFKANKFVACR